MAKQPERNGTIQSYLPEHQSAFPGEEKRLQLLSVWDNPDIEDN